MNYNKYKLKKIEYKKNVFKKPIVVAKGILNSHEFIILNRGTHPCSYIKLPPSSNLFKINYTAIPIEFHGGLSFCGKLPGFHGEWIGWDYAHCGDYIGRVTIDEKGQKYTTESLLDEMWNVTYDLERLRGFINLIMVAEEMII